MVMLVETEFKTKVRFISELGRCRLTVTRSCRRLGIKFHQKEVPTVHSLLDTEACQRSWSWLRKATVYNYIYIIITICTVSTTPIARYIRHYCQNSFKRNNILTQNLHLIVKNVLD